MHHSFNLDIEIWGMFKSLILASIMTYLCSYDKQISVMYENVGISHIYVKH